MYNNFKELGWVFCMGFFFGVTLGFFEKKRMVYMMDMITLCVLRHLGPMMLLSRYSLKFPCHVFLKPQRFLII